MKFLHVTNKYEENDNCKISLKVALIEISGSWGTPKYNICMYKEVDSCCASIEMRFLLPSPISNKDDAILKYKELGGNVKINYVFE